MAKTLYTLTAAGFTTKGATLTGAEYDQTQIEQQQDIDAKAPTASPTFTGTPAAPTAAPGTDTTQIANTAFVQAAIAALIAAAPAALDTLNELAAALGDDADFAATVTASLALKAPLASPALTGTPSAPTAAGGTSTTQLATTAFVQAAISALIDAAPGALDTLNELAAALGDDPAFATTVTNSLAAKMPLAGGNFSGTVNFQDNNAQRLNLLDYSEEAPSNAAATGAVSVNCELGNFHKLTLTGNVTLTFTNPPATGKAGSLTLKIHQDATGSRTITWPASVLWDSGTAPTLTTTALGIDVITLLTDDGGTTWLGFVGGQAFA